MRLFFALKIDGDALPLLKSAFTKLKKNAGEKEWDLKFTPFNQMHITLQFLGNVEAAELDQLNAVALEVAARHKPFDLELSGVDAFADVHQARVIWAGVQNKKNLQALQEDLEKSLARAARTEAFAYTPHLTLARLRNPRSVKDFISPFVRKSFGTMACHQIGLYKSELRGHYPHYELVQAFELSQHD